MMGSILAQWGQWYRRC